MIRNIIYINGFLFFSFFLSVSFSQEVKLVLPMGHTWGLNSAVFSPDEKRLLSTSDDGTAKIWDVITGKLLLTLHPNNGWVKSATFSKDGQLVLTSSFNATAKLWDAVTGRLIKELNNNEGIGYGTSSAVFSPDGRNIVTGNIGKLNVWDPVTGQYIKTLNSNNQLSTIQTIQFSPDGNSLLITEYESSINVVDFSTGTIVKKVGYNSATGKRAHGYITEFSPDGKKIVSVDFDNKAYLWDFPSGKLVSSFQLTVNRSGPEVTSIRFSPDGKKLVAAARDNMIKVWDAETGKQLTSCKGQTILVNAAEFSPDSKKILTASGDKTIRLWDAVSGRMLVSYKGHTAAVTHASFSRDGKSIVSISNDKTAKIWDVNTGFIKADCKGHTLGFRSAEYNPDSKKIITASSDNTAKIWDVVNGKILLELNGHKGIINYATFSPDGKKAVTVARDSSVKIWDAITGKLLLTINGVKGHSGYVLSAQFSPDSKKLITTSEDQSAKYWDAENGNLIHSFEGSEAHWNAVTFASFSRDGTKIVTISRDHKGKVWDAKTLKLISTLDGHGISQINSADFSPDGTTIITAANDGIFYIWDIYTGKPKQHYFSYLTNPDWKITYAKFFPSGDKILAIGLDGSIKILDIINKALLLQIKDIKYPLNYVSVSSDLQKIMGSTTDGPAVIWDINTGKQIVSFFAVDKNDYVLQLPNGFYKCTPDASKLLHYVTSNLQVISFEQLDVKYNRPDLILKAIGNTDTAYINTYRNAYFKRIKKLGIDTTSFRDGYSVPQADFANRNELLPVQTNEIISLHIKGLDKDFPLDRFNIWVNEVPVYGQRGFDIRSTNSKSIDKTIRIKLSEGDNRIETSITNINGTESFRMPLYIKYTPLQKQKITTYFIGLGIDHFQDSSYNLQYSVKDIRDLIKKCKKKYAGNIVIDTLFNENLTASNVKSLKEKLLATTVDDRVIISYSGHGLLSKAYDYYLSTYAVNFKKPEVNGLSYDDLETLLDSIPARKKLMLIDACHSGEVDKEDFQQTSLNKEALAANHVVSKGVIVINTDQGTKKLGLQNSFELMQNLFVNVGRSTGAIVISAASGTEFALEIGKLKNGVFTYCVLEAMDKYQEMKVSELKHIISKRVVELTNGLQKPTSRNETIEADWRIW